MQCNSSTGYLFSDHIFSTKEITPRLLLTVLTDRTIFFWKRNMIWNWISCSNAVQCNSSTGHLFTDHTFFLKNVTQNSAWLYLHVEFCLTFFDLKNMMWNWMTCINAVWIIFFSANPLRGPGHHHHQRSLILNIDKALFSSRFLILRKRLLDYLGLELKLKVQVDFAKKRLCDLFSHFLDNEQHTKVYH